LRDGDEYVLNGTKVVRSNALHKNCKVLLVMGKTDRDRPAPGSSSMMVSHRHPGVTVMRGLPDSGIKTARPLPKST